MSKALLLAAGLLFAAPAAFAQQMLDLNCIDALAAIDKASLAGVFSFIPQKDTPAAFSDLLVHEPKAMKKYLAKVDKDFKSASGITAWDHTVVLDVLSLYGSPLAATFEPASKKVNNKLTELSMAPILTLEQVTSRRKGS